MDKQVKFNRDTRDFDMYLDGQYVGSRATYTEASEELNRLVFERLAHEVA